MNASGLRSKLTTFKKVLADLQPSVFLIEETKYQDTGKLKLGNNFIIYELVRQSKSGGGLALGCQKDLQPFWVREGNDLIEALSVEIFFKNMSIRCCVAYGPQENDSIEKKEAFWNYLDTDVLEASKTGSGFVLHCDGNLWAGSRIVPGDPRPKIEMEKCLKNF